MYNSHPPNKFNHRRTEERAARDIAKQKSDLDRLQKVSTVHNRDCQNLSFLFISLSLSPTVRFYPSLLCHLFLSFSLRSNLLSHTYSRPLCPNLSVPYCFYFTSRQHCNLILIHFFSKLFAQDLESTKGDRIVADVRCPELEQAASGPYFMGKGKGKGSEGH